MERTKWIAFSRNAWGNVLSILGAIGVILSYATPETVVWAMTPFIEFWTALGWPLDPTLQERGVRAILAMAGIVGVISKIRSRMHPDPSDTTYVPQVGPLRGLP